MSRRGASALPWVIYPFRCFDCCLQSDVDGRDRDVDRTRTHAPARAGAENHRVSMGGTYPPQPAIRHGKSKAFGLAPILYEARRPLTADVDFAELYDPFTGMTLLHAEAFGLAPHRRRGPNCFAAAAPASTARCRSNTHGGLLSKPTCRASTTSSRRCSNSVRAASQTISARVRTITTARIAAKCAIRTSFGVRRVRRKLADLAERLTCRARFRFPMPIARRSGGVPRTPSHGAAVHYLRTTAVAARRGLSALPQTRRDVGRRARYRHDHVVRRAAPSDAPGVQRRRALHDRFREPR